MFLAAQNQILEDEVTKRTRALRKALEKIKQRSLETILRLSKAAEYKDDDTGNHLLRMSSYCGAISRQLGQEAKQTEQLLHAAPMHDVGKIGIPDHILLKPGKLDANEWEIMKSHSLIGFDILSGSDSSVIQLAATVALTHHEKWDGSGYPKRLKEQDIPLPGRIVAIADVFDALTSKRPYKEPFSTEKSFSIIKESRGTHFDPDVVDAFFRAEEDILKIKKRYSESTTANLYSIPNSILTPDND